MSVRENRKQSRIDCMKALRALSDQRRIEILNCLLSKAQSAGAIAARCGLTAYTASRQLAALKNANLIVCTKDGQHRLYGISPACEVLINRSARTLDLGCCQFHLDSLIEPRSRQA